MMQKIEGKKKHEIKIKRNIKETIQLYLIL